MVAISCPHKRGIRVMKNGPSMCWTHVFLTKRANAPTSLPQITLTTALIEAWHGVFTMHYQLKPWSHPNFFLDLAQHAVYCIARDSGSPTT
jgi:hypothetical protein